MKRKLKEMVRSAECLVLGALCLALGAMTAVAQVEKPVLRAENVRVEQRFPWTNLVDVCFTVTNTLVKNDTVIARVRGFYDGQMMLDMDHLYFTKEDGSPLTDRQLVGGDVLFSVDANGDFQQEGLRKNEVRLVWDAKKDVPPEAEWTKTFHVTVELEPKTQDVEVPCHNGIMVGEAHGIGGGSNVTAKIVSFLGVPFAHPPTNDFNEVGDVSHIRRWKAPEWAPTNLTAKIQAKRFAPSPLQPVSDDETSSSGHRSEDCLYLNIWTGYTDDKTPITGKENKPVLVFTHGGAFIQGGAKEYLNDCRYLAEKYGDVIFVTIEYRLSLLAQFDFSDLPGWDKRDYPDHGRLCLKDQQMALRWLKANVAAFGGDPSRITIAGESAGGISVFYLMAKYNRDENGEQLFQRAIPMSGAAGGSCRESYTNATHGTALCAALALTQGKSPDAWKSMTLDDLQKATEDELKAALMCPLEKVRAAGVRAEPMILSNNKVVYDLNMAPLGEGYEGDPKESAKYAACGTNVYDVIATTKYAVDLLTGDTGNESRYWANCFLPMSKTHPFDFFYNSYMAGTIATWTNALPAELKGVIADYVEEGKDPSSPYHEADDDDPNLSFGYGDLWCQTEILSELQFRLPQIRLAENHLKNVAVKAQGKGCYMYLFEKEQVRPDKVWARSMHASELPYLFNHPYYTEYGPLNRGLLDRFSEMIISFVRDGVPKFRAEDGGALESAPAYNTTTRPTVVIRDVYYNRDEGETVDVVKDSCTIGIVNDPKRERRRKLMPVSVALPAAGKN